eukprot:SAG22_NODE_602_length_8663_cov_17.617936_4_plen_65_part_00
MTMAKFQQRAGENLHGENDSEPGLAQSRRCMWYIRLSCSRRVDGRCLLQTRPRACYSCTSNTAD